MSNIPKFDCVEILAFSSDKKKEMEDLCHNFGGTVAEKCSRENIECTDEYEEYEHKGYYLQRKDFNYEGSDFCGD